ncbi:glycosyltransferase, partial [Escherichia coli]|uniref:glycosyltransferase family 4 protein n=6 Tax=Gammaproteobacteria TaxID=1236 RepID=UPI001080F45B
MNDSVVILARSLPIHNMGGMEVVCWDLCCSLAKHGLTVYVVTTPYPKGKNLTKVPEGIELCILDKTKPGQYSREWWSDSADFIKGLKDKNVKAIISISAAGFSCLKYKNYFPKARFIMQAHGTSYDEISSKIRSGSLKRILSAAKNALWFFKDGMSYPKFDDLVAIGESVYHSLTSIPTKIIVGDSNVVKIENGIDNELFSDDLSFRDEIRQHLKIPKDAVVFLSASRLHNQKGVDNNLLAFKEYFSLNNNSYYLVCGDGEEAGRLSQLASDLGISKNIIFLGGKERCELARLMQASDVFVFLTKRVEGLPLNVLEAMSSGLPVIISKHLTFSASDKVIKVNPEEYKDIASEIYGLLKSYDREKRFSYILAQNTLSYA